MMARRSPLRRSRGDARQHHESAEAGRETCRAGLRPAAGAESPRPEDRDEDGHHGITSATLERELKAAGFEILSTEQYGFRSSFTVARRPLPPCPQW